MTVKSIGVTAGRYDLTQKVLKTFVYWHLVDY